MTTAYRGVFPTMLCLALGLNRRHVRYIHTLRDPPVPRRNQFS